MSAWFSKKRSPSNDPPPPPPDDEDRSFGESSQTSYITGNREADTHRVRLLIDSLATVTSETGSDPEAQLALMVDRAIESVGAERGLLFRLGQDGTPLMATARTLQGSGESRGGKDLPTTGLSYTSETVLRVLEGGSGEYRSGNDSGDFDPSQSMIQYDIRSLMCVPLDMRSQGRGALYVDARASERPFARGDLRFFQAFAHMLEIVLRQREATLERVAAARMARDLQLAREIQSGFLPEESIRSQGYCVAGRVIPAEEAGGDYFDFFEAGAGRLAFAVGDVSGHGAGPALIMAGARAYLRSACQGADSAAQVLNRLNGHLVEDTDDDKFMSMFVGLLDPQEHVFRWANAGHPPPLFVRIAGGELQECPRTGMALGVDEDGESTDGGDLQLEPGDTLVAYTDGIVELRAGGDEQYGPGRLADSIRLHAQLPPEALLEAILADALKWAGSEHPGQDDLTVAVLRRDA